MPAHDGQLQGGPRPRKCFVRRGCSCRCQLRALVLTLAIVGGWPCSHAQLQDGPPPPTIYCNPKAVPAHARDFEFRTSAFYNVVGPL